MEAEDPVGREVPQRHPRMWYRGRRPGKQLVRRRQCRPGRRTATHAPPRLLHAGQLFPPPASHPNAPPSSSPSLSQETLLPLSIFMADSSAGVGLRRAQEECTKLRARTNTKSFGSLPEGKWYRRLAGSYRESKQQYWCGDIGIYLERRVRPQSYGGVDARDESNRLCYTGFG